MSCFLTSSSRSVAASAYLARAGSSGSCVSWALELVSQPRKDSSSHRGFAVGMGGGGIISTQLILGMRFLGHG